MTAKHDQDVNKFTPSQKRRKDTVAQADMAPMEGEELGPAFPSVMTAPRSMQNSSDILALQRVVGNQVVGRLVNTHAPARVQRKGGAADPSTIANEHTKYAPNFATPRSKEVPAGFQVTVAVSMEVPEYLQFAKTRMKSTIRNKVRGAVRNVPGSSAVVRKPKTGKQIKEKAAVKAAGKAAGTPVTDPAVDRIIQNSDSVGHSWIKLSPVGASGTPIQTYSFGFIPANPAAPHGPQQAVPGMVRNPDLEFEAEGNNRYLTTKVDMKSYQRALSKIAQLMAGPPAYMTIGYNCTQFTKDIAKVAGASFPSKAGMTIPISDRGFMKRALSPNALYSKLGNDLNTEDTSTERTMLENPAYEYTDQSGIAQAQSAAPRRNRGLELIDPMLEDDDPQATVAVDRDEHVMPTGITTGQMLQVDYNGRMLYAPKDALIQHLERQEPEIKSKAKLRGSLRVTTTRGSSVIKAGTQIMVTDFDGDQLSVESPRPDWIQGTCDLLPFWQAVSGVRLGD